MVNRIKSRLSGWKSRFLSFGGRLILLKSVLTALPVFALSFFKAPSGIISFDLFFYFIFGGEDLRKISWVGWRSVCLRKEYGGLVVRQLKEFNEALLGKWCWRMLVDRDGLWHLMLAARYGEEDERLEDGGQSGSTWWAEVVKIRDGIGGGGNGWFSESVVRRVGDGEATLFWHDRWCGDVALRERFSRLFNLALNKSITVKDMFLHGWGEGEGGW